MIRTIIGATTAVVLTEAAAKAAVYTAEYQSNASLWISVVLGYCGVVMLAWSCSQAWYASRDAQRRRQQLRRRRIMAQAVAAEIARVEIEPHAGAAAYVEARHALDDTLVMTPGGSGGHREGL